MRRIALLIAVLALVSIGCAPPPFGDPDNVRTWATTGSAVAVASAVLDPISFSDGRPTFFDSTCPATNDDGTTITIAGGCTDSMGRPYHGLATVLRVSATERRITFAGYGTSSDLGTVRTTGVVVAHELSATLRSFDVDVVHEGGVDTTVVYAGTVDGTYDGRSVWNGSGTIERRGGFPPTGLVEVTTVDEVVDGAVCNGQPVSGETTIRREDRSVVVTYDGETDCDEDAAARYAVDGEDRGTVDGILCTAAPLRRAGRGYLGILAVAAALLLRRVRRARL